MPAAVKHRPTPQSTPSSRPPTPAAAAPSYCGRPPHHAADDRSLLVELIGARAAFRVRAMPVAQLLEASPEQLAELGLGPATRRRLLAGAELARRFQPAPRIPRPLRTPRDCLPHLTSLRAAPSEVLAVLALDANLGLLGDPARVAEGALMHVAVAAREVFAPALDRRAAAIVLAHNHPSGALEPSPEDVEFTRHMARAGALLGIHLLDHLVLVRRGYFSFAEAGLLQPDRREALEARSLRGFSRDPTGLSR